MNRYKHLIPTVLPLKKMFIKNFLIIFRKGAWSSVLFVVNIVGLIILHYPAFYYPPLLLINVNIAIIITSFILTYIKKDYRNLENASFTLLEHTYHINALSISKDNKLLASCSGDNSVVLWDLQNKRLLKLFEHSAWVGNVVISLKNDCIFTVSGKTENLMQWDLTTYSKIVNRNPDNKGSRGLDISEDETMLVTSDMGGYVRIFNTNNIKKEYKEPKQLSNCELRKVTITKDNNYVFAGDVEGILYKYDIYSNNVSKIYTHPYRSKIRYVVLSSDDSLLALTDSSGLLSILNLSSGEIKSIKAHNGHAICAVFCPKDQFIASGGQDEIIRVWDIRGEQPKRHLEIKGHRNSITALAFDNNLQLYSASRDSKIMIWDLQGLYSRYLLSFPHNY